jgi:hypothetical protein
MTRPITLAGTESASVGRRARLALAILATLVLLVFVGVLEVAVLAAVTVVSAGTNHR